MSGPGPGPGRKLLRSIEDPTNLSQYDANARMRFKKIKLMFPEFIDSDDEDFLVYKPHNHPLLKNAILEIIFAYFNVAQLKICRGVCRVWDEEGMWALSRQPAKVSVVKSWMNDFVAHPLSRPIFFAREEGFPIPSQLISHVIVSVDKMHASQLFWYRRLMGLFGDQLTRMSISLEDFYPVFGLSEVLIPFTKLREITISGKDPVLWEERNSPRFLALPPRTDVRVHPALEKVVFNLYSPEEELLSHFANETTITSIVLSPKMFTRRTRVVIDTATHWSPPVPTVQGNVRQLTGAFLTELSQSPVLIKRLESLVFLDEHLVEAPVSLCNGLKAINNQIFDKLTHFVAPSCMISSEKTTIEMANDVATELCTMISNMPALTSLDLTAIYFPMKFLFPELSTLTKLKVNETAVRNHQFFGQFPSLKHLTIKRMKPPRKGKPVIDYGIRAFNTNAKHLWNNVEIIPMTSLQVLYVDVLDETSFPENLADIFPNVKRIVVNFYARGCALYSFFVSLRRCDSVTEVAIRDFEKIYNIPEWRLGDFLFRLPNDDHKCPVCQHYNIVPPRAPSLHDIPNLRVLQLEMQYRTGPGHCRPYLSTFVIHQFLPALELTNLNLKNIQLSVDEAEFLRSCAISPSMYMDDDAKIKTAAEATQDRLEGAFLGLMRD